MELPNLKVNVPKVAPMSATACTTFMSDEDIEKKRLEFRRMMKKRNLNTLVVGENGTGKTGIILDLFSKLPKKKMVISLDGGDGSCAKLINEFYPDDESIEVYHTIDEDKYYKDENGLFMENSSGYFLDYSKILREIQSLILYCRKHKDDYSAICFDGVSIFLKQCEYLMKDEKHLTDTGGFNQQYWKLRYKYFVETLQIMNALPMHRIYIAHADFIINEKGTAVREKLNGMIDERLWVKRVTVTNNNITYRCEIDKARGNSDGEGRVVDFMKVIDKKASWDCDEIFKTLKVKEYIEEKK